MTVGSVSVLNFLKANYGQEFSKQQIAKELGVSLSTVTGSMNSLMKKGYARETRREMIEDRPATETSKGHSKPLVFHTLTEAGLGYDPEAEEAQKLAEKEAARAAKAAAKAASNA